jgi:c-di-GMP-binding flagellar brake protein YcgR
MGIDRRAHPRHPVNRPAKLRRLADGRYLPAETVDLSAGGAMLELERASNLQAGETIELAIASHPREAILPASRLRRGRVVRQLGQDRTSYLAIQFAQPQELALPAAG